ncbi:RHS repeat-associated core domain-containing protein [Actinoplanes teichomyceticus]|uniref:RHS repeat-associated protein n=1 Tax=Actinoplanes teichomyceticus TaxID=1867 RepID=A0A561VSP2_ACTTI|nr:RHS repeat-associated core domain-containing protein [Actinoplanes teichomyceticus]TWG14642.1 RHS repeat-associated protein [Actinoplanes teichomyceticus]GIF10045.1 hypothetical protein Ate01nite_00770 [Actinoplanes teichomyceticus]
MFRFSAQPRGATALWRKPLAPWTRRLAVGLPLVVTSTLIGVPSLPASADSRTTTAPNCPASVADESAALITARLCGGRVGIDDATSETTTAVATPSGEVERTISAAPVRVERDGEWVPIDLTLTRNADGTVSPRASASDLVISGAQAGTGEHALVTAGTGRHRVAMGWTGKLAEPVLDGDRATYPNALPGVDLVVQATRGGAETFLVVKSKAAAAQVADVNMPITGADVASYRADATGNLTFLDADAKPLATSPQPLMWDARTMPGTRQPAHTRKVTAKVTKRAAKVAKAKAKKATDGAGVDITLTPDQAYLADSSTQYPVTIDPQINPLSTTFDTYVKQNDTVDRGGANDLQLGIVSGNVARSFVHWDTSAIRGKQITSAQVYFWNWWSPTCTASSWEIWTTGAASTDTRWTNQPAWTTKEATSTATKGYSSSCDDAWASIDGRAFFQRAANNAQASRAYMGIRATNEADGNSFKQFRSRNAADSAQVPYAVVNYNSYPVVGTRSTSPTSVCGTGTGRPFVNSVTPTLKAVITDGEASPVKGVFEWYAAGGAKIGGSTTASAASGSTLSATVPAGAFANGSSYSWRVAGNDGTVGGAWSSLCEFTVDTTAPTAAPTVSSATYPAGATSGAAGAAGTFTFAANGVTDAAAFLYGLNTNPPTTAVNASTVGGSASVSITPTTTGSHTLYVRSRDRAGNLSPVAAYAFTVGSTVGSMSSPASGSLSPGKVVLSGAGASTSTGVTYQWRRGETDAWTTVPAADVAQSSGAAVTWPVPSTGSGRFGDLTWNVENTVNAAEAGPDALDGPVQVRASFTGGAAGTSQPVQFALDRDRAEAPTAAIGPGEVNLLTGNFTVSAKDATDAGGLGVGRSFNTRRAATTDPLFGRGWISSTDVPTGSDYRTLGVTGSLVQIGTPDGDTLDFVKKATTSTGVVFAAKPGADSLTLEYRSADNTYLLADAGGNVTTFARASTDPANVYSPVKFVAAGTGDTTAISWEQATVDGATIVRPTRAVAPAPAGVTCSAAPLTTVGCKTLTYTYATATTATATAAGDYAGRVKQVSFTAYDPAKSAMSTVVLQRYSYTGDGLLAAAWDPRRDYTNLNGAAQQATTYAYDANGVLNSVTPPGEQPWRLSYTTLPGDAGAGRLSKVTRSALDAGTAVTTLVYRVPVTGANAPVDLAGGQTARWGQTVQPVDATAVFPPTQVPGGDPATGVLPSSWAQATVTYLDGNARELNTREPGQHITTRWYNANGDVTRELSARNRQRALDASATDGSAAEATLAAALSTQYEYSPDGQRITDVIGPEHDVVLGDWTTVRGRTHTALRYDEGAPAADSPYNLVTTRVESVRYWNASGVAADADARTTRTEYDWKLRRPTAEIVDPSGLALTTRTAYDPVTGLVASTTLPGGDETTAATRTTVYYQAGTGSGDSRCDSRPEWAGLTCRVGAAAQPATDPELPDTYYSYTMYGQPTTAVETNSAGTLRTVTTGYDAANRPSTVTVTAGASLGTPVEQRRNVYDAATDKPVRGEQLDASGTVIAKIVRGYDSLGRTVSYTDADGVTSTTTYDVASRPRAVNDGKGTRTLGYDDAAEGRGLVSQLVDSQVGSFTNVGYDADGQLITETRPDGLTVNHFYDETGTPTGVEYVSNGSTVYADWAGYQAQNQRRWYSDTLTHGGMEYDGAGRLTSVSQTVGTGSCTMRGYAYDKNSNRTAMTTYNAAADGSCQSVTPATTQGLFYDAADRVSKTGYAYDDLGRSVSIPGNDTIAGAGDMAVTYYVNDMARTITQGTDTTVNTLDVQANRFRGYRTTTGGATIDSVNHYGDDSDNPTWTSSGSSYWRVAVGVSGVAALVSDSVVQWQIVNLHGDIVATRLPNTAGLAATYITDESGRPTTAGTKPRYGYLGAYQRSGDNAGGLITMGVRLYNPSTGRFLSTDPVYGGNANAYEYCNGDVVNCTDTTGLWSVKREKKWPFTIVATFNAKDQRIMVSTYGAGLGFAVGAAVCALFTGFGALACGGVGAVVVTGLVEYYKEYQIKDGCDWKMRWAFPGGVKKRWREGRC